MRRHYHFASFCKVLLLPQESLFPFSDLQPSFFYFAEHPSGAVVSTEGELDVQEHDENEEDENGELGEDEEEDDEVEDDDDEDDPGKDEV